MQTIYSQSENCKYSVMSAVLSLIEHDNIAPIILCIGSNGVTGDSLGPVTGYLLTHKYNIRTFVYGTISRPVVCGNIMNVYRFIKKNHTAKIIAVDAALGNDINAIRIFKGGLKPAAAVNMDLPFVGDYCITANVNYCGINNVAALKSASLKSVGKMADNIACGINDAVMLYRAAKAQAAV